MTEIAFPEFDLARMHANADEAADLLKTLSNPHRLLILCFLAEGEISVADLNDRLPLSQSALSQHLAVLRTHQLIATRRDAQSIYYSLADSNALPIIRTLHDIYC